MALLEVSNISSGYGAVQVLWDLSLQLERGKLTALVGSNSMGKSTLLRTVVGQIRPWQGSVTFDAQDVTRVSPHAKASMGMIMVPEGRPLFTEMSVAENLEMGAFPRRAWVRYSVHRVWKSGSSLKWVASGKARISSHRIP